MASDPHTDDLPDRLDLVVDRCLMHDTLAADLRAAAAELRRLRDRDAALTRLLDAVGDVDDLREVAVQMKKRWPSATFPARLERIAAAVEDIDREHER